MAHYNRKSSDIWVWLIIGIIVATIAVASMYYIGWFDNNTHVDSPDGDNVTQQYTITTPGADTPGEADWQNAGHETLREAVTKPDAETETPPEPEYETVNQ